MYKRGLLVGIRKRCGGVGMSQNQLTYLQTSDNDGTSSGPQIQDDLCHLHCTPMPHINILILILLTLNSTIIFCCCSHLLFHCLLTIHCNGPAGQEPIKSLFSHWVRNNLKGRDQEISFFNLKVMANHDSRIKFPVGCC